MATIIRSNVLSAQQALFANITDVNTLLTRYFGKVDFTLVLQDIFIPKVTEYLSLYEKQCCLSAQDVYQYLLNGYDLIVYGPALVNQICKNFYQGFIYALTRNSYWLDINAKLITHCKTAFYDMEFRAGNPDHEFTFSEQLTMDYNSEISRSDIINMAQYMLDMFYAYTFIDGVNYVPPCETIHRAPFISLDSRTTYSYWTEIPFDYSEPGLYWIGEPTIMITTIQEVLVEYLPEDDMEIYSVVEWNRQIPRTTSDQFYRLATTKGYGSFWTKNAIEIEDAGFIGIRWMEDWPEIRLKDFFDPNVFDSLWTMDPYITDSDSDSDDSFFTIDMDTTDFSDRDDIIPQIGDVNVQFPATLIPSLTATIDNINDMACRLESRLTSPLVKVDEMLKDSSNSMDAFAETARQQINSITNGFLKPLEVTDLRFILNRLIDGVQIIRSGYKLDRLLETITRTLIDLNYGFSMIGTIKNALFTVWNTFSGFFATTTLEKTDSNAVPQGFSEYFSLDVITKIGSGLVVLVGALGFGIIPTTMSSWMWLTQAAERGRALTNTISGLNGLSKIFEWIRDLIFQACCYFTGQDPKKVTHLSELATCTTEMQEWAIDLFDMDSPLVDEMIPQSEDLRDKILIRHEQTRKFTKLLMAETAPPQVVSAFREAAKRSQTLYKKVCFAKTMRAARVAPICICLAGETNIGKTTAIFDFINKIGDSQNWPNINRMYSRCASDKFWTGYCQQKFVIQDDVGQIKDSTDMTEMFQICTTSEFIPPMAAVEEKGIKFNSKVLFQTTNVPFYRPAGINDYPALFRRRNELISCAWADDDDHTKKHDFSHIKYAIMESTHGQQLTPYMTHAEMTQYLIDRVSTHLTEQSVMMELLIPRVEDRPDDIFVVTTPRSHGNTQGILQPLIEPQISTNIDTGLRMAHRIHAYMVLNNLEHYGFISRKSIQILKEYAETIDLAQLDETFDNEFWANVRSFCMRKHTIGDFERLIDTVDDDTMEMVVDSYLIDRKNEIFTRETWISQTKDWFVAIKDKLWRYWSDLDWMHTVHKLIQTCLLIAVGSATISLVKNLFFDEPEKQTQPENKIVYKDIPEPESPMTEPEMTTEIDPLTEMSVIVPEIKMKDLSKLGDFRLYYNPWMLHGHFTLANYEPERRCHYLYHFYMWNCSFNKSYKLLTPYEEEFKQWLENKGLPMPKPFKIPKNLWRRPPSFEFLDENDEQNWLAVQDHYDMVLPEIISSGDEKTAKARSKLIKPEIISSGDEKTLKAKAKLIKPEIISSGDEKTARARAKLIKCESGTIMAEGSTDMNATTIRSFRVAPNMGWIKVEWTDRVGNTYSRDNNFFGLRGRWLLTDAHIFLNRKKGDKITYTFNGHPFVDQFDPERCKQLHALHDKNIKLDLCLYRASFVLQAFRDNTKHLIREADLKYIGPSSAALNTLRAGLMNVVTIPKLKLVENVNYTLEEEKYSILKGYGYEIATVPGDCGGVLSVDNTAVQAKIIGIHTAGTKDQNCGFATPLTFELIDSQLPKTLECTGPVFPQCRTSDSDLAQLKVIPEGRISLLGRCMPGDDLHQASKTDIEPNLIHDLAYTHGTEPAILIPSDPRNTSGTSPLQNGVSKFGDPIDKDFDVSEIELSRKELVSEYKGLLDRTGFKLRKWTLEEAINGVDGDEYSGPINMRTSPGLPYVRSRPAGASGKEYLFSFCEETGKYSIKDPVLLKRVQNRMAAAERGDRIESIWCDSVKDERRKLSKIPTAQSRLFNIGPVDFVIVYRMYFGSFQSFQAHTRHDHGTMIGMDVDGPEWTRMIQKMKSIGSVGFDSDFKAWDGHFNGNIIMSYATMVHDLHEYCGEVSDVDALVRLTVFDEIVFTIHQCLNTYYFTYMGIPSGVPGTANINSDGNKTYHRVAYRHICRKAGKIDWLPYSFYKKHVWIPFYGDDNWPVVSDIIKEVFNGISCAEFFIEHGRPYTPADKNGEIVKYKLLEDCIFLKRGVRAHESNGKFTAPMDILTIQELTNWVRKSPDIEAATFENLLTSLRFAHAHGKTYFNAHVAQINNALRTQELPQLMDDYSDYDDAFLAKFF